MANPTIQELDKIVADAFEAFAKKHTSDEHQVARDALAGIAKDYKPFEQITALVEDGKTVEFTKRNAEDVARIITEEHEALFKVDAAKVAEKVGDVSKTNLERTTRFLNSEHGFSDEVLTELTKDSNLKLEDLKKTPRPLYKFVTHHRTGNFSSGRTAIATAIAGVGLLGARALFFGGRDEQPIPPTYQNGFAQGGGAEQAGWAEREAMRQAMAQGAPMQGV